MNIISLSTVYLTPDDSNKRMYHYIAILRSIVANSFIDANRNFTCWRILCVDSKIDLTGFCKSTASVWHVKAG